MSEDKEDIKTDPESSTNLKNSKNVTIAFKVNGKNYPIVVQTNESQD